MRVGQSYYPVARANETVFRNVLRDLHNHRNERPMGDAVPENLETEASLDEIFQKYSESAGFGMFTITNFSISRLIRRKAKIEFQQVAFLSGGGVKLQYLVKKDGSVQYQKLISCFRS